MDTNPKPPEATIGNGKSPERYIRTFEGDMSVFKSGGVPELIPFKKSEPAPAERLVESSPLASVPISLPAPAPEPIPTPVPKAIPAVMAPIKTYSSDFSDRMKETHASAATIVAAEQDTAEQAPYIIPEAPDRKNLWYIMAGVAFLIIGGGGAYFAYSQYLAALTPVPLAPSARAVIFVDSDEKVSGSGTALLQAIKQSVDKPLGLNTVRLLSLDEMASQETNIFAALPLRAPGILLRNIEPAGSMAGIVKTSSSQSPFFILSVEAYGPTFSGMLSWEPLMQADLAVLFPLYPAPKTTSTATTTKQTATTTTAALAKPGFRDEVVSNHDVRIYRDASGRSILLYGYWNQATLVIARDPAAFAEILGRLATSHAQ